MKIHDIFLKSSTKLRNLGTEYLWVKRIQVCTEKDLFILSREIKIFFLPFNQDAGIIILLNPRQELRRV